MKNNNEPRLTDKQCIVIYEYVLKTGLIALEEMEPNEEEKKLGCLSPFGDLTDKQKIFFGRSFYEVLTKAYYLPKLNDEQCLYVFDFIVNNYPKEIADLFLEAATIKEDKIALGRIFWQLAE